ncbi:MAG TPA: hypothetical protein VK001_09740 [Geminicoccaceae bacterium]|nr:hypothetical protein [Geminicoccaceae bacterium]
MTVDWFTLAAQLVNFALLLVLLRVFLYRPVLNVMAAREELAAAPLREARRVAEESAKEREALQHERAAFEHERIERLARAAREAEEKREQLLEAVEREAAELRRAAAAAVEREVGRVADEMRVRLSNLVIDEVRRTLASLAGAELDQPAWARFEERLRALPAEQRRKLAAAAAGEVKVVTPRPLPAATSEAARAALTEVLGVERVRFATDPDLLLGVALEAGGLRLDGAAVVRLEALERSFAAALGAVGEIAPRPVAPAAAEEGR